MEVDSVGSLSGVEGSFLANDIGCMLPSSQLIFPSSILGSYWGKYFFNHNGTLLFHLSSLYLVCYPHVEPRVL